MKKSFQDILKERKFDLLLDIDFPLIKKTMLYGSCISNYRFEQILFQMIISSLVDVYIFLHEENLNLFSKSFLDKKLQYCLLHCVYYLALEKGVKDPIPTINNIRPKEIKLSIEGLKEYYVSTLKLIFQYPTITIVETLISILCTIDYLFSTEQDNQE
jgi:hypothetical protein